MFLVANYTSHFPLITAKTLSERSEA